MDARAPSSSPVCQQQSISNQALMCIGEQYILLCMAFHVPLRNLEHLRVHSPNKVWGLLRAFRPQQSTLSSKVWVNRNMSIHSVHCFIKSYVYV